MKTPGATRPSTSHSLSKSKFKLALGKGKSDDSSHPIETAESQEVTQELRRYLSDEIAYHNALAHKWLGVDAGENGGTTQGGIAVGFLAWAKKELEELKSGSLSQGGVAALSISDREKDLRESRRSRVLAEIDKVDTFLKVYKRMNDTVRCHSYRLIMLHCQDAHFSSALQQLAFQTVPTQSELQASIPAGRNAVAMKSYASPVPEFGPGSVEHTRRQAEELELLQASATGNADAASPVKGQLDESYAGAGSYF